jgi:hypothetical protein
MAEPAAPSSQLPEENVRTRARILVILAATMLYGFS